MFEAKEKKNLTENRQNHTDQLHLKELVPHTYCHIHKKKKKNRIPYSGLFSRRIYFSLILADQGKSRK